MLSRPSGAKTGTGTMAVKSSSRSSDAHAPGRRLTYAIERLMLYCTYDTAEQNSEGLPVPVRASWYDDAHTIAIVRIQDPWTMAELSGAIRDSRALFASVDTTVDVIWDGSETNGAPSNLFSHFMIPNEDTEIPVN